MLVSRQLLETLIDLKDHSAGALRLVLDDVGLEVKSVEEAEGDTILNIETLANRGDHASHHGVATELSGRLLRPVRFPELAQLPSSSAGIPVRIETPLCGRYTLVDLPRFRQRELPAAMASLLRRLGSDLYGQAADVTNFVNLELGQPMHAFDRALVEGEVRIAETAQEEDVEALDGKIYRLPVGALVIRDAVKIIAVAGVIGCANSCVSEGTEGVLLESALFDPVRVRTTARAMKLSTRASFRFERGGDAAMVELAQRRAIQLLGVEASGYTDLFPGRPGPRRVRLRFARLFHELGGELPRDVVRARLAHLGFGISDDAAADVEPGSAIVCEVPPHRLWDVEDEQDLVEEVAKAHGYDALPEILPAIVPGPPVRTARDEIDERVQAALVAAGFHEVIGPALHGPELAGPLPGGDLAHPLGRFVQTTNSLESAFSTLRNTNVTVLCRLLRENVARGVEDPKIFERGTIFLGDPSLETGVAERWVVTAAATGRWASGWRDRRPTDFSLMKGVVESLAEALRAPLRFVASEHPLLQPYSRADVLLGARVVGHVGKVHPEVAGELRGGAFYLELWLEPFVDGAAHVPALVEPSEFPAAPRDLTWVVPDGRGEAAAVLASDVEEAMREAAGELLADLRLVDLYRPKDGDPRLTWRLTFQSRERTLRREEVEELVERAAALVVARQGLQRG